MDITLTTLSFLKDLVRPARIRSGLRVGGMLSAVVLCGIPAIAQSSNEWTGATNSNYGTAGNWSPSSVPGSNSSVLFGNIPSTNQTINLGAQRQLTQLNIHSNLNYTFTSGDFVATNGPSNWNFSGSGNFTFNTPLRLNTNLTITHTGSGLVTYNSDITNWGSTRMLTISGSGTSIINSSIGGGVNLTIQSGINTFTGNIGSGIVNVSGGTNVFDNALSGGGKDVNITGGDNTIIGNIGGGADINVNASGGSLNILGNIGGGADIQVSEGALTLNGFVDGGASVLVESGGTLLLNDGVSMGGGSVVTLDSGTLVATGSVSIPNVTLTGDSVIDLGNDPNAQLNLGNISGSGTINVINYVDTNQVVFNPAGTNINIPQQVSFEGSGSTIGPGNTIIPVEPVVIPEPGISVGILLLGSFIGWHAWRRRQKASEHLHPPDGLQDKDAA